MKITYTPIPEDNKNRDAYVIKFNFEHGDADLTTFEVNKFYFGNSSLEIYLKKFEEISSAITDSRSSGVDLPMDFENNAFVIIGGKEFIPLQLDKIYRCSSNYFASVSIDSILWYSATGDCFKVSYK